MKKTFLFISLGIFVVLSAVFYLLHQSQPQFSFPVLMGGNIIMLLLSIATWLIVNKQMTERPQAFVRGVYSATFLKLMVCLTSILVYALMNRHTVHKPSLFMLFGIYAVYTGAETWLLSKMARTGN